MVAGSEASVFFSTHALADLDLISSSAVHDRTLPLRVMNRAVEVIAADADRRGAVRTRFDRWVALVDELEVIYDVMTREKVMVVGVHEM